MEEGDASTTEILVPQSGDGVGSSSQPTEVDHVCSTSTESLPEEATDTSDEETDDGEVDVEISRFSCEIEKDGTITINGYVKDRNKIIQKNCDEGTYMQSDEQFKPVGEETIFKPGPFQHSFHLPGPIDPRKFTGHFSDDGIFKAFVMKYKAAD
ncbi:hypothetical protein QJS10_CPA06g01695 [Acorus calamus]|uniref:Uncharacterized protein n=1 Tax=Acorus calamus TaxID=4465 RepID=A0AAV9EJY8_ACOCL|nr:hypothetical protein QJS10_CPA06g01695 [Acorus calamus]